MSVFPTISKIFERVMQSKLNEHINQFLSPIFCGYRTGFGTQSVLLLLIKRWKIMLDNKGHAGTINC